MKWQYTFRDHGFSGAWKCGTESEFKENSDLTHALGDEPFFDLTDNLRSRGRKTAKDVYNCRGFVAHHTTDAWFWTSPIGNVGYGMWPTGAAWCCQHLWEHYAFGVDRKFLKNRAYPAMKEAAEFFLDFLVEDPKTGKLISGPSISPENRFRTPGDEGGVL